VRRGGQNEDSVDAGAANGNEPRKKISSSCPRHRQEPQAPYLLLLLLLRRRRRQGQKRRPGFPPCR
jgi:hypothetical protein